MLLASVGWKRGCRPFSCPWSENVTYCRKEIYSTYLFQASIPAIPFGISRHPLPTRSRFLTATVRSTSSALWLHHAHPFVAASEKIQSHAEKQRVLVTELLFFKKCDNALISSPMWLLQTRLLASVVWKRGCQPFTCPCSENVTHCRKEICSTYSSKESMPFVKSKPPLPTRSLRSLRAAARSTSSLWLHHACKR